MGWNLRAIRNLEPYLLPVYALPLEDRLLFSAAPFQEDHVSACSTIRAYASQAAGPPGSILGHAAVRKPVGRGVGRWSRPDRGDARRYALRSSGLATHILGPGQSRARTVCVVDRYRI